MEKGEKHIAIQASLQEYVHEEMNHNMDLNGSGHQQIRRPRQTQGGARQGIRQASLAAPAARAAAVAAAACSSGRISELARPSEARCFPPGR